MDVLYDETEKIQVRHVGLDVQGKRYDFSILYTDQFHGKCMVACLQTGKMRLLSCEDLQIGEWASRFQIPSEDREMLRSFLQHALSNQPLVSEC